MDDATAGDPVTRARRRTSPRTRDRLFTWGSLLVVGVPWLAALVHVVATSPSWITLPDDLALIELHTRRAMVFSQSLGVFDHSGWSHPGPAYFYLQAIPGWLFGSGARSLFVGATLLGGLSALACVWLVQRCAGAPRAMVAAGLLAWLGWLLCQHGRSAMTYSEGHVGALVSPWNPMVVIVPMLLLLLLAAAAVDGSGCSLLGSLLVGSCVLQADISTTPVVGAVVLVGLVGWLVTWRRARWPATSRARGLGLVTIVAIVAVWVPPVIEQVTGNPGNLTLLWRFFTAPHPGQSLAGALWTSVAATGVGIEGPREVMASILGGPPLHEAVALLAAAITVVASAVGLVVGWRQQRRFALGLAAATLVGSLGLVVGALHIVGFPFGYLVVWAGVLPIAAVLSLVLLAPPRLRADESARRWRRAGAGVFAVASGVLMFIGVLGLPPVTAASDPEVGQLAALVRAAIPPGAVIEIDDAGAGTASTQLLDVERFIGLVNQLDTQGYHPTVNVFWRAQFGSHYLADGRPNAVVTLSTWTPGATTTPGYVGRVGDMAVAITR